MNDPFSEVLLREDVLITDRLFTLTLLQVVVGTISAGLCVLRKVGGSVVGFTGWPRLSRGALG